MKYKNSHRPGYKHTAVGWIPEEWHSKNLGECSTIKGEYGINAAAVEYSTELPTYLRITDIDDDNNYSTHKKVSVDNNNSENYILEEGDIVFARTGATVGKTYLHNKKIGRLVFAGFLIRFRLNSNILLPYYLKLFTTTKPYWDWIKISSARSGQPGINATEYCELPIPLPPLLEQKKIAEILSTWDSAIETLNRLVAAKIKRKKGLMQQLLTGPSTPLRGRAKSRLKGFSREWKYLHIYDVSRELNIRNKDNKNLTVLSCTKYDGLVPSLEYFGRQIFSNDLSTYKIVPKNCFAYATNHIEEGSIGYQSQYSEAVISPMYTVFQTISDIDDNFLFGLLKSHNYIHEYNKRMEGSINRRGGLRWEEFSKIKIPVPPLPEQQHIASILSTADDEINILNKKLEAVKQQKKGLMQKLLTGEVRVGSTGSPTEETDR